MSAEGSLGRQWTVQHHGEHPFGGEWSSVQDESGQDVGHARYRPDGGWRDHRGNPLTEVSYRIDLNQPATVEESMRGLRAPGGRAPRIERM